MYSMYISQLCERIFLNNNIDWFGIKLPLLFSVMIITAAAMVIEVTIVNPLRPGDAYIR